VLLCTLWSLGVLGEQLWCSVCSCQLDQFVRWHKLWGAGTSHGVHICRAVARSAAWSSFKAHRPGWRAGFGEHFSLLLPSYLTFGGDISKVLAPWKDGKSFLPPCQSFPRSPSPTALPYHSRITLYVRNIQGTFGGLLAYHCWFPVISMSKRWHSSLTRVPPIPLKDSPSLASLVVGKSRQDHCPTLIMKHGIPGEIQCIKRLRCSALLCYPFVALNTGPCRYLKQGW